MAMVTSWLEGQTERRMISWEEDGRVDGSEEGEEVTGLLEGPIYTSEKSVMEEPTEIQKNVRCLCA